MLAEHADIQFEFPNAATALFPSDFFMNERIPEWLASTPPIRGAVRAAAGNRPGADL